MSDPEYHDEPTSPGVALDLQREAATRALAARPGFDVASATDDEFERSLERVRTRQRRMLRILDAVLVPAAHYGNPNNAWKKPRLFKAGAEELTALFRLSPRLVGEPAVVTSAEFVSVTIRIAIFDSRGHYVAERGGNCNTTEKRFKSKAGGGFTWTDAREAIHDCYAMAEKRALVAAVLAATGADAFFSDGETMEKALAAEAEDLEDDAMAGSTEERRAATKEDLRDIMTAARAAGIPDKHAFGEFVDATLGRRFIGAGDVETLKAAIARAANRAGERAAEAAAAAARAGAET